MRKFLLLFIILTFTTPALAQTGLAKLKEEWRKKGSSSESMASFLLESSCNEYVTCQGDSFNNEGDMWKFKLNCSTCAGDSKRGLLRDVTEAGYQIINTTTAGSAFEVYLQRRVGIQPGTPEPPPTTKTDKTE